MNGWEPENILCYLRGKNGQQFKTVLLLGLLTGIILFIGSFWGEGGLTIALVMSIADEFRELLSSRTRSP